MFVVGCSETFLLQQEKQNTEKKKVWTCEPKEKQFKLSWEIDDANDDPNDFSGKTQG